MLRRQSAGAARRRQRGEILLVTLVFLLLSLLVLILSMRDTIVSTTQAGNNLTRQKDAQVADVAMQSIRNQIMAAAPAGLPLTSSSAIINQPWWRDLAPTSTASNPSASYWKTCLGNTDATQRCGAVPLVIGSTSLPYAALAVVQPTGRTGPNSPQCSAGVGLAQGVFYAVFIHVQESSGLTSVNTESVYQACEQRS